MQQFRDGVAEWAAFANLHFTEFTGTPPANYITVRESPPGAEGGFSSSVGMAGGEQFVECGFIVGTAAPFAAKSGMLLAFGTSSNGPIATPT